MIKINGIEYRDLEEQVYKNAEDIEDLKEHGTGPVGPKGPQGPMGPQGRQGIQGAQGEQGPRGLQGLTGPKGDKGEDGTSFEITGQVAQANDLPPVSSVSVGTAYFVGTNTPREVYVALYNNGVLQWTNQGQLQGPEGPVGPEGPQGPQGVQGLQGVQGDEGPVGPQGPKGDKGDTGPEGPQGPRGAITVSNYFLLDPNDMSTLEDAVDELLEVANAFYPLTEIQLGNNTRELHYGRLERTLGNWFLQINMGGQIRTESLSVGGLTNFMNIRSNLNVIGYTYMTR